MTLQQIVDLSICSNICSEEVHVVPSGSFYTHVCAPVQEFLDNGMIATAGSLNERSPVIPGPRFYVTALLI